MFEIIYNDSIIISQTDLEIAVLGIALLCALILLVGLIWQKLHENSRLKYEFITIIAHKFRTPLTYVKWSSDGLLNDEHDPYKKHVLADIKRGNESLIKLTNTLLEITESDNKSRSSYVYGRLNLCDFVHEVAENYRDAFHQKNIFFSVACLEDQVFVKIDKARMEFVLQVLFENALAYTPTGRTVEVVVGHSGRKAFISVQDHGIGMDKKTLSKLFTTKFFRAENAKRIDTEGFGVGLYLAKSVIRRHRGKIEAFSDGLDGGSTFRVTLRRVK